MGRCSELSYFFYYYGNEVDFSFLVWGRFGGGRLFFSPLSFLQTARATGRGALWNGQAGARSFASWNSKDRTNKGRGFRGDGSVPDHRSTRERFSQRTMPVFARLIDCPRSPIGIDWGSEPTNRNPIALYAAPIEPEALRRATWFSQIVSFGAFWFLERIRSTGVQEPGLFEARASLTQ